MRYLIYGAGTIGLTYAYLLTAHHDVDVLALPERYEKVSQGVPLAIKDLRQRNDTYQSTVFHPQCITSPEGYYREGPTTSWPIQLTPLAWQQG